MAGCRDLLFCASLLALVSWRSEAIALGSLKLDNYTFDKVLSMPGQTYLVKFDQSYAYGEKEDEFKELCKLAYSVPGFLIAEVPVQEYGDKENADLMERYKLTKDDFPAFFLFDKAKTNNDGLRYTGAVKAEDIGAFLRGKGIKFPSVGSIAELDVLAKKFLKGGLADADFAEAKKLVDAQYSTDKKAAMYLKIMQKIQEKGEGYLATESARVVKLLEGNLTPEKKAELNDKLKVLNAFTTVSKEEL